MLLRPIVAARQWWLAQPGDQSWENALRWFSEHGFAYSGPEAFILARPWHRSVGIFEDHPDPNCWFVFMAAGQLTRFMDLAPYPLPLVAFHKRGILRFRTWASMKEHIDVYESRSTTKPKLWAGDTGHAPGPDRPGSVAA